MPGALLRCATPAFLRGPYKFFNRRELKMSQEFTRRRFLATVAVAVPAGAALMSAATASAADLPKLDPNDPSAKALGYVADAKNVDRKSPLAARYAAGQTCATCQVIQGKDGEAYRPCAIFPGKLVAAAGWCSAWAKKA
jgi:High potential iron-sulfur protein